MTGLAVPALRTDVRKVHYSGWLRIARGGTVTTIAPGLAACDAFASGLLSDQTGDVTCRRCLRLLDLAAQAKGGVT